jgi:ribosome-binding factor A
VRMSPDLKIATAYVTPLGVADHAAVIEGLNRHAKFIRGRLGPQLRQMKYMPDVRFRDDTSFDNYQKIDSLLRSPEVSRDLDRDGDDEE